MTEFAKWIAGLPSNVEPEAIRTYQRAVMVSRFPAYTMESVVHANARDLHWAMELLEAARKLQEKT